jgi:hypothetical protein
MLTAVHGILASHCTGYLMTTTTVSYATLHAIAAMNLVINFIMSACRLAVHLAAAQNLRLHLHHLQETAVTMEIREPATMIQPANGIRSRIFAGPVKSVVLNVHWGSKSSPLFFLMQNMSTGLAWELDRVS